MGSTTRIVRGVGLLLTALSTGVLFGTRAALSPSSRDFAPTTYVEVQQATVRNLRPVVGTLLPAAVLANLAALGLMVGQRRSPAYALTVVGTLGPGTALVLTGVYELPADARVLTWSAADPPPGWETVRDRWERVHTARTVASVAGLAALVAAVLAP